MNALLKIAGLAVLISTVGCVSEDEGSTAQRSYPVQLRTSSYTTASILSRLFVPEAHAAVSEMKFCFKRLRFKQNLTDLPTDVEDNIDFNLGEAVVSSSGQLLGSVNVPAGTYYRVEFDLEPTCGGVSASVTNDFGTFTSTETLKIKFDGVFVVDGSEVLELGVQNILNEANAHSSGNLAARLEAASGNL